MPDTLNNIPLPANTWVDLYAESGEAAGAQLVVQNLGSTSILLATKATEPLGSDGFFSLAPNEQSVNELGDSGAWAYSPIVAGALGMRVAL